MSECQFCEYNVTIGIPVYNAEKYIGQTMDSVLNQTYASIEFLILDDCGTDSSMSIIREYQQMHSRGGDIHILSQPRNMGVSAARNRIIDEAQGRFLYFMDADDVIETGTITLLMEHQQRTGAEIVYGSYDKIETYNANKVVATVQYPLMELTGDGCLAEYAWHISGSLQTTIWNFIVDVEMLRRSKIRFIDTDFWEDMAFTFDMLPYCQHAVLLSDITYHYMCHYNSLSKYQKRDTIGQDEVLRNISIVNYMKRQCAKTMEKPYQPQRCQNVLTTGFFVLCYILNNKKKIMPSFTNAELKDIMRHPATFSEIMRFEHSRTKHVLLWVLGKMPARILLLLVTLIGKVKHLT